MAATITTRTIKDGAGVTFTQQVLDVSGSGAGPFLPLMIIGDSTGAALELGQKTAAASLPVALASDQVGTAGSAAATVLTVQGIASGTAQPVSGLVANPSSVLTRPADTTAYSIGDLVASSTTAGSVVVPSFTATLVSAGYAMMRRFRLYSNITTGLSAVSLTIEFWSAAPTFTNGDNGAYTVATGAAGHLGRADVAMTQVADGAYGIGVPFVGGDMDIKLASGTTILWTVKTNTAFTPISGQTFTIVPEILY